MSKHPGDWERKNIGGLSIAGCVGLVAFCILNAYLWCTGILWTLERLGWL